jgi:hypothetical protein
MDPAACFHGLIGFCTIRVPKLLPGGTDKPASGETVIIRNIPGKEGWNRQGVRGGGGIELRFGQDETFQGALENVYAEGRDAVASLAQRLRREVCEDLIFAFADIHGCDEALLRSTRPGWYLLREFEHGRTTLLTLLAQAQRRSVDIAIHNATGPYDTGIGGKALHKVPALPFNPGVFPWMSVLTATRHW